MFKRFASRVYDWLTRVEPLVYVLLYLGAILAFAGLYNVAASGGFYAPYAHLERSWQEDEAKLRLALTSGLSAGRISNPVWPNIADKDVKTRVYAVAHSLEVRERDIRFVASIGVSIFTKDGRLLTTVGKEAIPGWSSVVTCRLSFEPSKTYESDDNNLLLKIDPDPQCSTDLLNVLYGLKSGGIVLPIPYHEQERARDLVYGFNGDPASVAGNYWRMLYLSVVIITTLGLGDIIPLSSMARGLVGAEAVCGIVLMGLFLNAIAWRASLWRASLEQNVWQRTRRRVGMKIGWTHSELSTRFTAANGDGSSQGQNFYEVLYQWTEDLLADIVNAKRDFSYAFTAEMADCLEMYEQSIRQNGLSLRMRQFRNLDTLADNNDSCIEFLKIVKLTDGDLRMLAWTVNDISRIKGALTASDLASAKLPPPPTNFCL